MLRKTCVNQKNSKGGFVVLNNRRGRTLNNWRSFDQVLCHARNSIYLYSV